MVEFLIMPGKFATLGLLKIKVIWKKCYDVIISLYDVTNQILSRDVTIDYIISTRRFDVPLFSSSWLAFVSLVL